MLKDYPVAVTVDKGFLTPDTQGPGFNVNPTDLALTADQDDLGDLFGFYQSLGADETVDTSDNAGNNNAAGIVATIEKDAGFNDDGRRRAKGDRDRGWQVRHGHRQLRRTQLPEPAVGSFVRDSGTTQVPGPIDLKLYAVDQFQNLVGDEPATITDDTPVARVDIEAGAGTDFINDNPTARASSPPGGHPDRHGHDPGRHRRRSTPTATRVVTLNAAPSRRPTSSPGTGARVSPAPRSRPASSRTTRASTSTG